MIEGNDAMMKMSRDQYDDLAEICGVMANPTRLRILIGVMRDECNVKKIQLKLGLHQAAVSRHLSIMRHARLVKARREGLKKCYTVISPIVGKLIETFGYSEGATPEEIAETCELLKALSNTTRIRIIAGLIKDECNVKRIQEKLGLPQSTVSQHLNVLKSSGIVASEEKKKRTCYIVIHPIVRTILTLPER